MPSGRVFIGNVTDRMVNRDVEKFFKNYGPISEINLKRGYGFVQFEDLRDAEDAVHDLDGKELMGERLRIELARSTNERSDYRDKDRDRGRERETYRRRPSPPPRRRNFDKGPSFANRSKYRLVAKNLSSRTSWQDLKDFFRSCGDITYTNVNSPRPGYGVIEFADRRGMEAALDSSDLELHGKMLKLVEERDFSKSRSRSPPNRRSTSKSPSRSRSRSRDD